MYHFFHVHITCFITYIFLCIIFICIIDVMQYMDTYIISLQRVHLSCYTKIYLSFPKVPLFPNPHAKLNVSIYPASMDDFTMVSSLGS